MTIPNEIINDHFNVFKTSFHALHKDINAFIQGYIKDPEFLSKKKTTETKRGGKKARPVSRVQRRTTTANKKSAADQEMVLVFKNWDQQMDLLGNYLEEMQKLLKPEPIVAESEALKESDIQKEPQLEEKSNEVIPEEKEKGETPLKSEKTSEKPKEETPEKAEEETAVNENGEIKTPTLELSKMSLNLLGENKNEKTPKKRISFSSDLTTPVLLSTKKKELQPIPLSSDYLSTPELQTATFQFNMSELQQKQHVVSPINNDREESQLPQEEEEEEEVLQLSEEMFQQLPDWIQQDYEREQLNELLLELASIEDLNSFDKGTLMHVGYEEAAAEVIESLMTCLMKLIQE